MPLSAEHFDAIRSLVERKSAIVLDADKTYLVEARMQALVRSEGLGSVAELVARLARGGNGLAERVVEAMTTNETSFFRDRHPFEALRTHVLPDLIARRAASRRLRVWCGAASSGQEPYSLAMLLAEDFPQLASWRVDFLATDLSKEMLERCRAGLYTQIEVNRGLPAKLLVKYFRREGAHWRIRDDLRRSIDFRPMNLVEPWPPLDRADLVMLRNVLIYFSVPTKKEILGRLRKVLAPDGYLFLGGAETTFLLDDAFERAEVGTASCYRLRGR